jgi:hypothetical protein
MRTAIVSGRFDDPSAEPSLAVKLGSPGDSGFLILPGVLEMKVVSPRTP